jgi:regulator of protease activity HflC (stomatin/prohibitin superfamily)
MPGYVKWIIGVIILGIILGLIGYAFVQHPRIAAGVVVGLVLIVGISFIIYSPWFTVKEQQAAVIERLGQFNRQVGPGLHVMLPFGIERRRKITEDGVDLEFVDQRERTVDLPAQSVITQNNVQLQVDSMAYYQITDPKKAIYGVNDVIQAVDQLIKTVLRDVIGATTLQELLSGREEINEKLREQVERASGDWGITIRSVELQSVNPPESYVGAMRRVSEAELAKQASITEAEGKKQASILEAEGEAEKINQIYKAIHEGNPNDELLKIKYLEALEKIADGNATKVFMPFPANPTGDNFFQQAFGMAAGLDAYREPSAPSGQPRPSGSSTAEGQGKEQVRRKKVIRRVPKKTPPPAEQ